MDALFAAIGLADAGLFVRAVVAFLICLALLALVFLALGWVSGRSPLPSSRGGGRQPRLGVIEETSVDAKRRLILVRRDNAEHLILTGGPNDLVVEGPILRGAAKPRPEAQRRAITNVAGAATRPAAAGAVAATATGAADKVGVEPAGDTPIGDPGGDPFAAARARAEQSEPKETPAAPKPAAPKPAAPKPAASSPVAPPPVQTQRAPAGHRGTDRSDAALADAFARDLEADLQGDPLRADIEARVEADLRSESLDTGYEAPAADPRVEKLAPAAPMPFPTGAIPTPRPATPRPAASGPATPGPATPRPATPEPTTQKSTAPEATPPETGTTSAPTETREPFDIDAITGPRRRGQVPLDDEPTPELPRFLRGGQNADAPSQAATPSKSAEPTVRAAAASAAPTQLSPRTVLGMPSEPERADAAQERPEEAPAIEIEKAADGRPSSAEVAGAGLPESDHDIRGDDDGSDRGSDRAEAAPVPQSARGEMPARPFDALYRAREGLAQGAGEDATGSAARPGPKPSPDTQPQPQPDDEAGPPATTAPGASDMRSLERQMENLLRELTTRGKSDGEKM